MHRPIALVLAVGACGAPPLLEPGEREEPEIMGFAERFELLGRHEGGRVVPRAEGPGGWTVLDDALVALDGTGAAVDERSIAALGPGPWTVWDRQDDRFLLASDAEVVELDGSGEADRWTLPGPVRAARLGAPAAVLVQDGEGCALVRLDGADPGTEASCGLDGDLEGAPDPGVPWRVAVDDAIWALQPGSSSVERWEDGVRIGTLGQSRVLTHVAARHGVLVVLTDEGLLREVDVPSGRPLGERAVFRPTSVDALGLSDDGAGVLVRGEVVTVFFALHRDRPGYLIPEAGSQTGAIGGGGGGGEGGRAPIGPGISETPPAQDQMGGP